MKHVHFVGFRTDAQYSAAVKVWGKPDFIHMFHDTRMWGGHRRRRRHRSSDKCCVYSTTTK